MYCQHRPSQSSSITVKVSSSDHSIAREVQVADDLGRVDHRRDRASLVPGAAAPDFAVCDFAFVRIVLPFLGIADADRVDVRIDRDQPRAGADLDEEIAQAVDPDLVGRAELLDFLLDALDDVLLGAAVTLRWRRYRGGNRPSAARSSWRRRQSRNNP